MSEETKGEVRAPQLRAESVRSVTQPPTASASQLDLANLLRQAAEQLALQMPAPVPPPLGPTFGELAKKWLDTEGKRLVAPENERRHLSHLEKLWEMREAELTPRVAREALLSLLSPSGPLGSSTVNKVRSTAKRVVREAQISGEWMGQNPFAIVRRLKERKPDYETLRLEELNALLPHLRRDRQREALVMVMLGPRPGEIRGLKKEQVDLQRKLVTWSRSNDRDSTKTGRARTVPIPNLLVGIFEEAIAASTSEFVFPCEDGRQQRADTKMSRVLRTALAKAGIVQRYNYSCRRKGCGFRDELRIRDDSMTCPKCLMKLWCHPVGKALRWYDLRHSAATLHREAGCDPLVVKLALGHAARSVTDDIYTHLSEDFMRKELNKLSGVAISPNCHSEGVTVEAAREEFTAPSSAPTA